jgi:GNAT superfamily N-acetyltransferase
MIEIRCVSGDEVEPWLGALARLRIRVFREFPYLYEGSESYERQYLESYAKSRLGLVVLAVQADRVVGASTAMPLTDADQAFQQPFLDAGVLPQSVCYFGESVLEPSERGKGLGHRFFDERERHALGHGFSTAAFCSVIREPSHPLRPADFRDHHAFWIKRGYRQNPDLVATLGWRQIDQGPHEVVNQLVFWQKSLR